MSFSRGSSMPLSRRIDDHVRADFAVQGDHGRDVFEVEDEHRLAADLAQHHVFGADVADGRHHPALPARDESWDSCS